MYSLDINFLNDRPDLKPDAAARTRTRPVASDSKTPLYLGIAAGVFFPALVAVAWLLLQNQHNSLTQQQADLDNRLTALKTQLGEVDAIRAQTTQIQTETEALATVFNQIKPWSAMAQDLRDRTPAGIQIRGIEQIAAPPGAAPSPVASPSTTPSPGAAAATPPPPAALIKITGTANSFDTVNDFLLTLQRSSFLKPDQTKLVSAELGTERSVQPLTFSQNSPSSSSSSSNTIKPPKLPAVVLFEIQSSLNDVPTSDLLRELERKGAVGIVTRIENLQEKGVVPPPKGVIKQ